MLTTEMPNAATPKKHTLKARSKPQPSAPADLDKWDDRAHANGCEYIEVHIDRYTSEDEFDTEFEQFTFRHRFESLAAAEKWTRDLEAHLMKHKARLNSQREKARRIAR